MGPRKRAKPNPTAETVSSSEPQDQSRAPTIQNQDQTIALPRRDPEEVIASGPAKEANDGGSSTPRSARSWYSGTWAPGSKAIPVTQVAKESITAAAGAASEIVASARAHTPPLPTTPLKSSPAIQRLGSSSRSLPLAATTTKLNIISGSLGPMYADSKQGDDKKRNTITFEEEKDESGKEPATKAVLAGKGCPKDASDVDGASSTASEGKRTEGPNSTDEPAGWLAWFSKAEQAKRLPTSIPDNESKPMVNGEQTKRRPQTTIVGIKKPEEVTSAQRRNSVPKASAAIDAVQDEPKSWLNLWGNVSTQPKPGAISTTAGTPETANGELESPTQDNKKAIQGNGNSTSSKLQLNSDLGEQAKSSGWAFWSRDMGNKTSDDDTGELALAGSPSQTRPEKDTLDDSKGVPNKVGKQQRPQSSEIADNIGKLEKDQSETKKTETLDVSTASTKDKSKKDNTSKLKLDPPNLLLPSFKGTYASASRPGLIQQMSNWLPFTSSFNQSKHLNLVTTPPRVKKALVIGVHGFFPAPLVRSFLGQPTGTSIRFANSAASAIQKWTQAQGYSCEVEKVALEGEGKIADRIDILWKLMLNWIDKISKADFVFVACHSQGCPVALMLVAKLIAFGCVSSARVGVCAMAGINLGPFIDYKSRWIGGTALELFEFARQDSKVSKEYETALDTALRFGVKIVYVGSIDDQLVSLEV